MMGNDISITQKLAELLREKYAGYRVVSPIIKDIIPKVNKKIVKNNNSVKVSISEEAKKLESKEQELEHIKQEDIKNPYFYNLYIDNIARKLLKLFGEE